MFKKKWMGVGYSGRRACNKKAYIPSQGYNNN